MDLLSHFFIPLIVAYAVKLDQRVSDKQLFFLAFLGLLADLDVFFGVHRLGLHSLLLVSVCVLLPFLFIKDEARRTYLVLAAYFLYSHIILDFFNGGVPLLWPLSRISVGINFSFIVTLESGLSLEKIALEVITKLPTTVEGKEFSLVKGPGIVAGLLYLFVISSKWQNNWKRTGKE